MKLTRLSLPKLSKIRRRLNTFLYGFGFNVALDEAEQKKKYKQFVFDTQETLRWQVKEVISNIFNKLLEVAKFRVKPSDNKEWMAILDSFFKDNSFKVAFEENSDSSIGLYFKWAADIGGQAGLDKLGIDAIFGVNDPAWFEFLENAENLLIDSVDITTKEWIAGFLSFGLDAQLTPMELGDLLMTEVKGMSQTRAELIAQTELANVMNATELESYKRAGIQEKQWKTSRDERVCPICAPLEGKVIKTEVYFESQGVTALHPPIHPRCRCFLQAIEDAWWEIGEKRVWTGERVETVGPRKIGLYPTDLAGRNKEQVERMARRILEGIPNKDTVGMDSVFLRNIKGPGDRIGGIVRSGDTWGISVYLKDKFGKPLTFIEIRDVFAHEIGHGIFGRLSSDDLELLKTEFDKFIETDITERNYKINVQIFHGEPFEEFVSESYNLLRNYPSELKKDHPSTFRILKEILKE